jgi:prepilin-type N-terminal cleavage/methylation domain-containing protein
MNLPLTTYHSPLTTHHLPFVRRSRRSGFTLIEILVATTILLVIVILASLVFQQTTGAYQTGERKVNAQVALRNVVGAMTRDLALAVDSGDYDGLNNNFGSGSMTFVALTGTPGKDAHGNDDKESRTARLITYSSNGRRTEKATTCTSGKNGRPKWSTKGDAVESLLYDKDAYEDVGSFNMDFEYDWPAEDPEAKLPERIYIRVELEGSGQAATVGAGSGGRRGWDSPDEIWVGVKPGSE